MFDLRWIRENPEAFDAGLGRRGLAAASARVLELDASCRAAMTEGQEAQARRNELSRGIGRAKAKGEDTTSAIAEVARLKDAVQQAEERERQLAAELETLLSGLPNLVSDEVPDGVDETANVEVRRIGEPRRFEAAARQHFELGEMLGLMDFEAAARIAGARFVVLRGPLARLERALATFMLDVQTGENGYTEISGPLLVRAHAAYGTANLPKFEDDLFRTTDGFYLIPTAEMTLTNLVREQILDEAALPLRYTAWTPCFRSEAGAAGKDTRGMIRQHQFAKVEMVSVVRPEDSDAELERMTACAEDILRRLALPFRTVLKCVGDTGFAARRTYDIEVWLPGQATYREISSCSVCGDFQARRMNARYRPAGQKGTRFLHTLNGSGLAVGRALVAVLENYQQPDGSVAVPEVLRPYLGGLQRIAADG